MNFADNITALRLEKKISKRAMAQMIGVTPATYGGYESGDKIPTLETAAKIADSLGVSLDLLAGREEKLNKKYLTYGDIIREINNILLSTSSCNMIEHKTGYAIFDDNFNMERYIPEKYEDMSQRNDVDAMDDCVITLGYVPFADIIEPWQNLLKLYLSNKIDKEVYTIWIEKKIKEFSDKVVLNQEYLSDQIKINREKERLSNAAQE